MKIAIWGRGVCAEAAADALEDAGGESLRLDPEEVGAGTQGAALVAHGPDLLVRVAGPPCEDERWERLRAALPDCPALELHLADPPDPRAASLLGPLVAGRRTGTLAVARAGQPPRAVEVPLAATDRGDGAVRRAVATLGRRLLAAGPGGLADAVAALDALPEAPPLPVHAPLAGALPELPDEIDWRATPLRVARLVRALAPFGGAPSALGGEPVHLRTVERSAWTGPPGAAPGTLALDATGARVRCGGGAVRVLAARIGGVALDRSGFARFAATLGGPLVLGAARPEPLPFGVPELGREEEAAVVRTLRSRWIGTGPTVAALEEDFCDATGARHAVAVSSCTAALHLALLAAGVGPGDEVVTTPLTFVATVNAILYTGATPVFADVEPDTLNLDPAAVEAAVGPRTRAIVPVHFGGRPCDMARLRRVAARHGVTVVEDAAHAVGARYPSGRAVGGGPAETCFSFYPNKNLTSCEGGIVTTRSPERAERYARMRMHGLTADAWKRFGAEEIVRSRMVELGFKYNLTDLQAAIGRVQLGRLERWTEIRGEQAAYYREALAGLRHVAPLPPYAEGRGRHAYHLFTLRIQGIPRDLAQVELRRRGIGAAVHYEPVHLHPFYREQLGHAPGAFPVAEAAGESTLTLPIGPSLRPRDLERVVAAVQELEMLPAAAPRPARAGSAAPRRVSKRSWSPRPTTLPGG